MKRLLRLQLLSSLVDATKLGIIQWQKMPNHSYVACNRSKQYQLNWLYWYDSSGITIDRQGAIISASEINLPILWGTQGIELLSKLLIMLDAQWSHHIKRIDSSIYSLLYYTPYEGPYMVNHDLCLQLLSQLLIATRSGSVTWHRSAVHDSVIFTEYNERKISFEYLRPIDYNERPLDGLVVKLILPNASVNFACGTDCYFIVEEIFAAGFKDCQLKLERSVQQLRDEVAALKQLMT